MKQLTPKQERFAQAIVVGMTLSDAYRAAFLPKKMSNKAINEEACKLAKNPKIAQRVVALRAPVVAKIRDTMADRLKELSYAAFLDPADCFDEHGQHIHLRAMPEHVRRAIAGYEVDPVSFVTKVKFVDKRGAIMDYSKLVGDIPDSKKPEPPQLPSRRIDLSTLSKEEWEALTRGRAIMQRLIAEARSGVPSR